MPQERLQKILSRFGIASRRKAEALIQAGHIKVNGQVCQTLGAKADPYDDRIEVLGRLLPQQKSYHYYAYYKPRGLLVTKKDELGRQGIFATLKLPREVNAVGRLDKNSEGLLLLSDDGSFIQEYTHPSFQITKLYHVKISRRLKKSELCQLIEGIPFETKILKAHQVKKLTVANFAEHWIEIELREGMKREIRRMMEYFQVKVLRLIRIQHGSVSLGSLKPGDLKLLSQRPQAQVINFTSQKK